MSTSSRGEKRGGGRRICLSFLVFAGLLFSCDGGSAGPDALAFRFLFSMRGLSEEAGRFVAVTSDPAVGEQLREELGLPEKDRHLIIGGPIARGNGGHNLGWQWHFIPGEWQMAELWTEVCDGVPSMIEKDPGYWIDEVGSFCPWDSFVVEELLREAEKVGPF